MILQRLIEAGYFPRELPPEFTSISLSDSLGVTAPMITAANLLQAEPEVFSLARFGHARRTLRIPNPLHYVKQAKLIEDHWEDIQSIIDASSLSQSKPTFKAAQSRATSLRPSQDLAELRLLFSAGERYILRTDYTRFFASIYTHSIPWALHGRAAAKNNRRLGGAFYGNDIDKAIRDGQSGQTVGIPVGPDISHILSELIGARIDSQAFDNPPTGDRYVDDYFLCFPDESTAKAALSKLTLAAGHYELDINYDKTSIRRIEDLTDDIAPLHELSNFEFDDGSKILRRALHAFFSVATRLSITQENALKYAIRILAQRDISDDDWPIYEAYLLRAATLSPNSLDVIAYSLYRHSLKGAPLDKSRITEFFSRVIVAGTCYSLHSDVAWARWIFKALGHSLPESVAKALSLADNSIVVLLALDLREKGLVEGTISTGQWTRLLSATSLYGEHWLLAYESARRGWLQPRASIISSDPLFEALNSNAVTFYDDKRTADLTLELRDKPCGTENVLVPARCSGFFLQSTSRQ